MKTSSNLSKSFFKVALATVALLLIPLIAMQFTTQVNWAIPDFFIMGMLLFITGSIYVLLARQTTDLITKLAYGSTVGLTFIMVWANLAIGLIGSGSHWGNFMYIGILAVIIIGSFYINFKPAGMTKVMYLTSLSFIIVTAIAIIAGMGDYPASSIIEIIAVNGVFAVFYAIIAAAFGYISKTPKNTL